MALEKYMSGFKRFGSPAGQGRGKFSGGFKSHGFGGGKSRFSAGAPTERREMHATTCANCGDRCDVPFRPNGSKPVLCQQCFRREGRSPREEAPRRDFTKPDFAQRRGPVLGGENVERKLEEMNAKLDRVIRELESLKALNA